MDTAAYARMGEQEHKHWWFAARREIIAKLITSSCDLPKNARLLEAGCGTGGNLSLLSGFGKLDAFEFDETSRTTAQLKSGMDIPFGALPDDAPFAGEAYDLIALLDVLEHIEHDTASLTALGERLDKNGRILITVPAMPWLWSKHDVVHHHFRRYTRNSLKRAVENAGLEVEAISYFNCFLFPFALMKRGFDKLTGSSAPDDEIPSDWMNKLFFRIFRAERHLVSRTSLPWGLSLYAIVKLKK
ncbi:methyltransferase [Amylibacter kogurei]|uniref:Methyltransferase n=1 Tax=Paramylibacter kogurei TaxID=1889778 RepID=A0A2G5K848_9RHOB|nr:class I SAM-dependent methyltransferase [Amylibacter kogurei]PIB25697.1 methyltransferase [Amylibacter kogurei]